MSKKSEKDVQDDNSYLSGEIIIYERPDGECKVETYIIDNDVWMNQYGLSKLFQTSTQNIGMHIKNIYEGKELEEKTTCKPYLQVQTEGSIEKKRKIKFYNLDMILSVGFRAKSSVGGQFRRWANVVLKEYMQKGFVMDDERLKNPKKFGEDYYDELIARIRSIRASEKRFYEKIRQIYTLSIDYSSDDVKTKEFFATVQNKMHYSIHGHTAAEVIYDRADADKENMGLTSWSGVSIKESDAVIAKNYLNEREMEELERTVVMYLDHAEDMARRQIPMYMEDWKQVLDKFLIFKERNILCGSGTISAELAKQKALKEYEIFDRKRISEVTETFMIDDLTRMAKDKSKQL
jgi:hypothetical protein